MFNYWQKIFQEELPPSLLGQVKKYSEEKEGNNAISSKVIFVEHLIRMIKTFKIIQERFRLNKRSVMSHSWEKKLCLET